MLICNVIEPKDIKLYLITLNIQHNILSQSCEELKACCPYLTKQYLISQKFLESTYNHIEAVFRGTQRLVSINKAITYQKFLIMK